MSSSSPLLFIPTEINLPPTPSILTYLSTYPRISLSPRSYYVSNVLHPSFASSRQYRSRLNLTLFVFALESIYEPEVCDNSLNIFNAFNLAPQRQARSSRRPGTERLASSTRPDLLPSVFPPPFLLSHPIFARSSLSPILSDLEHDDSPNLPVSPRPLYAPSLLHPSLEETSRSQSTRVQSN